MKRWDRRLGIGGSVALAASLLAAVAWLAARQRDATSRCPAGLSTTGPRCCALGQTEAGGRCVKAPEECPASMERRKTGCVVEPRVVSLPGGTLVLGPSDWEAEGRV